MEYNINISCCCCCCWFKLLKLYLKKKKTLTLPLKTARASDISLGGTVPNSLPNVRITFDRPEGTDKP